MYHSVFIALFLLPCVWFCAYRRKAKKKWCSLVFCFRIAFVRTKHAQYSVSQCWNWSFSLYTDRHVNVNNYIRCRPINTSFAPSFRIYLHIASDAHWIVSKWNFVATADALHLLFIATIFRLSDVSHKHPSITWFRWCRSDSQKSHMNHTSSAASSNLSMASFSLVAHSWEKKLFGFCV